MLLYYRRGASLRYSVALRYLCMYIDFAFRQIGLDCVVWSVGRSVIAETKHCPLWDGYLYPSADPNTAESVTWSWGWWGRTNVGITDITYILILMGMGCRWWTDRQTDRQMLFIKFHFIHLFLFKKYYLTSPSHVNSIFFVFLQLYLFTVQLVDFKFSKKEKNLSILKCDERNAKKNTIIHDSQGLI